MDTSPTTTKIDAAILRLQTAVGPLKKNSTVSVTLKTGDSYTSGFATYARLHEAVAAQLIEQAISVTQLGGVVNGVERLFIRLAHDGEWIVGDFPIVPTRPGSQGFGGGVSFTRRWSLLCALNIVLEDDQSEKLGYQDQRAPSKVRQKAPAGIADALGAIRAAVADADFTAACNTARANFPREPEVEKTIAGWFVHALPAARTADELTALRDLGKAIKPRGGEVLDALRTAEARLVGVP